MEFYSESHPIAKKRHRCEACNNIIFPGIRYCRQSGKWEGEFFTRAWCSDCETIMNYYFDYISTESEFDYECVEDYVMECICCDCPHGVNEEDDCHVSVWHCERALNFIKTVRSKEVNQPWKKP